MKQIILSFCTLLILFSCRDKNTPEPIDPDCDLMTTYQFYEIPPIEFCPDCGPAIYRFHLDYINIEDSPVLKSIIRNKYIVSDPNDNTDGLPFTIDTMLVNSYNTQNQVIQMTDWEGRYSFTYDNEGNVATCEMYNKIFDKNASFDYTYTNNKLTRVNINDSRRVELSYEGNSLRPTKIIRYDTHETFYRTYDSNNNLIEELYLNSDFIDSKDAAIINYSNEFIPNTVAQTDFQDKILLHNKNKLVNNLGLIVNTTELDFVGTIPFLDINSGANWTSHLTDFKVNSHGDLVGNADGAKVTYQTCE